MQGEVGTATLVPVTASTEVPLPCSSGGHGGTSTSDCPHSWHHGPTGYPRTWGLELQKSSNQSPPWSGGKERPLSELTDAPLRWRGDQPQVGPRVVQEWSARGQGLLWFPGWKQILFSCCLAICSPLHIPKQSLPGGG